MLRACLRRGFVARLSEKFASKARGQKRPEVALLAIEDVFGRERSWRTLQPAAVESTLLRHALRARLRQRLFFSLGIFKPLRDNFEEVA